MIVDGAALGPGQQLTRAWSVVAVASLATLSSDASSSSAEGASSNKDTTPPPSVECFATFQIGASAQNNITDECRGEVAVSVSPTTGERSEPGTPAAVKTNANAQLALVWHDEAQQMQIVPSRQVAMPVTRRRWGTAHIVLACILAVALCVAAGTLVRHVYRAHNVDLQPEVAKGWADAARAAASRTAMASD